MWVGICEQYSHTSLFHLRDVPATETDLTAAWESPMTIAATVVPKTMKCVSAPVHHQHVLQKTIWKVLARAFSSPRTVVPKKIQQTTQRADAHISERPAERVLSRRSRDIVISAPMLSRSAAEKMTQTANAGCTKMCARTTPANKPVL